MPRREPLRREDVAAQIVGADALRNAHAGG
jgi:hypothetical protein